LTAILFAPYKPSDRLNFRTEKHSYKQIIQGVTTEKLIAFIAPLAFGPLLLQIGQHAGHLFPSALKRLNLEHSSYQSPSSALAPADEVAQKDNEL